MNQEPFRAFVCGASAAGHGVGGERHFNAIKTAFAGLAGGGASSLAAIYLNAQHAYEQRPADGIPME